MTDLLVVPKSSLKFYSFGIDVIYTGYIPVNTQTTRVKTKVVCRWLLSVVYEIGKLMDVGLPHHLRRFRVRPRVAGRQRFLLVCLDARSRDNHCV
jgi:hypothetical protein